MYSKTSASNPLARTQGVLIQELPDEVLVYDLEREKAHCLNQTAALVWRCCDGQTSIAEIAGQLSKVTSLPDDEEVVQLALRQLNKAHLLQSSIDGEKGSLALSRRAVLKRLGIGGIGAVAAIPVVTSIIAPTAQAAGSCLATGEPCMGDGECCNVCCRNSNPALCNGQLPNHCV